MLIVKSIDCSSCSVAILTTQIHQRSLRWQKQIHDILNLIVRMQSMCLITSASSYTVETLLCWQAVHMTDEEPLSCLQLHLSDKPYLSPSVPAHSSNQPQTLMVINSLSCRHVPHRSEMSLQLSCKRMTWACEDELHCLGGYLWVVPFLVVQPQIYKKIVLQFYKYREIKKNVICYTPPLNPTSPPWRSKLYEKHMWFPKDNENQTTKITCLEKNKNWA